MKSRRTCAIVVLALALAGCSDDGPGGGTDDPPSSQAPSTGTPSTATSDAESVEPATGTPMTSDWVDLHLPAEAEWIITRNGRSGHHLSEDGTTYAVFIGSAGEGFDSLDEVSRSAVSVLRETRPSLELGDNRTVAGVEGLTMTAEDDGGYYYRFDTARDGFEVSISFEFPVKDAAGEAWIESVLASVEWK